MKHLKKFNESIIESKSLNDLRVGEYYTRHIPYYNDDAKCIFKYKGRGNSDNYINVYMFCATEQEEFQEDTQITIATDGTGKGSYVTLATQEEIDFLHKNKKMSDEGYFDNLY